MRYNTAYIEGVVDIRKALTFSKMAASGKHSTTFKAWYMRSDRSRYDYTKPCDELLRAMWSIADTEVLSLAGNAKRAKMEWSGLTAILAEMEERGMK